MRLSSWTSVSFADAFADVTSTAHKVAQEHFLNSGKWAIVDQGSSFVAGYSNDDSLKWNGKLPVVIFGDHTRALKFINFPFVLGADGTKVLQTKGELTPRFGYYCILNLDVPSAGYSRHFKFLKDAQISYPIGVEQQRLATLLDKADHLRRTRRYAQQLSGTFLQSVFLEMFGDPVTNPKGWDRARVSDIGCVETGNTPSREIAEYYGETIEWIKSDNIIEGEMYLTRSREMLSDKGLKVGRSVDAGSVLVTCIAGSTASIGNAAMATHKVAFNQQINAVTPKKGTNPFFLYSMLVVSKPLVQRSTTEGMKRIITKSKFEDLLLIKPPLPLQEQFAEVARRTERLRGQQREAARQAEHLFQTLLARAFRGEV